MLRVPWSAVIVGEASHLHEHENEGIRGSQISTFQVRFYANVMQSAPLCSFTTGARCVQEAKTHDPKSPLREFQTNSTSSPTRATDQSPLQSALIGTIKRLIRPPQQQAAKLCITLTIYSRQVGHGGRPSLSIFPTFGSSPQPPPSSPAHLHIHWIKSVDAGHNHKLFHKRRCNGSRAPNPKHLEGRSFFDVGERRLDIS